MSTSLPMRTNFHMQMDPWMLFIRKQSLSTSPSHDVRRKNYFAS